MAGGARHRPGDHPSRAKGDRGRRGASAAGPGGPGGPLHHRRRSGVARGAAARHAAPESVVRARPPAPGICGIGGHRRLSQSVGRRDESRPGDGPGLGRGGRRRRQRPCARHRRRRPPGGAGCARAHRGRAGLRPGHRLPAGAPFFNGRDRGTRGPGQRVSLGPIPEAQSFPRPQPHHRGAVPGRGPAGVRPGERCAPHRPLRAGPGTGRDGRAGRRSPLAQRGPQRAHPPRRHAGAERGRRPFGAGLDGDAGPRGGRRLVAAGPRRRARAVHRGPQGGGSLVRGRAGRPHRGAGGGGGRRGDVAGGAGTGAPGAGRALCRVRLTGGPGRRGFTMKFPDTIMRRECQQGGMPVGTLVIVESPAKARTISKFLGRGYTVKASIGHVRDLPKSQFGVDVENDFAPRYITIRGKGKILQELREHARKADRVLLATDPDREGEAISWHLAEALKLDPEEPNRIQFHEITREAVKKALKSPRPLDGRLIDAYQARRVLDRIVGYKLSPLLWSKVRAGLSAGRVQSVAVRLICDREREIEAFVPEEYWSITGTFAAPARNGQPPVRFVAKLIQQGGKKVHIPDEAAARTVLAELSDAPFRISQVKRGQRRRNPAPPFITSTLQQEASRRLGFSARKTMSLAQQLYEGLDVGPEGTVGLITYMRTDATRVAAEAQQEAQRFIDERFGADF